MCKDGKRSLNGIVVRNERNGPLNTANHSGGRTRNKKIKGVTTCLSGEVDMLLKMRRVKKVKKRSGGR